MSPADFASATAKALGKKNKTPKAKTAHQLKLEAERKGLEALASVEVPVRVEEPVAEPYIPPGLEVNYDAGDEGPTSWVPAVEAVTPGLAAMRAHPMWGKIMEVATLREQADQAETDFAKYLKMVENLTKDASIVDNGLRPLQREYARAREQKRTELLGDPELTFKRTLREALKGQFQKMLDVGVQAEIEKDPILLDLQQRLAAKTAEAEAIMRAKEEANANALKSRELSRQLAKQADELAAVISL